VGSLNGHGIAHPPWTFDPFHNNIKPDPSQYHPLHLNTRHRQPALFKAERQLLLLHEIRFINYNYTGMLAQLSWSSSTTHTYVLTAIRPASPRHNHTDVHACKQGSRSQIGGCVVVGFAQVSMRDKGVLVRTGVAPPGLKVVLELATRRRR